MRTINPEKHAERRRQILDAALHCFARYGFHKTRTAEICAVAGMSPGNLFHYFPDKNALVIALVEADQAETTARYAEAATAADGWLALLGLLDQHLAQCTEPVVVQLTLDILGEAARKPELMACVRQNEAARLDALQLLLERHVANGQLRLAGTPRTAANWFLLLMDGVMGRAMVESVFDPGLHRHALIEALLLQVRPNGHLPGAASA